MESVVYIMIHTFCIFYLALMNDQVVDRIVGPKGPKCKTLTLPLFGRDGCTSSFPNFYGIFYILPNHKCSQTDTCMVVVLFMYAFFS